MSGLSGMSLCHFLKDGHAFVESAGDVEASLPLSPLEGEKDLPASVEIAVPLAVFGIGEFLPCVFMDAVIPLPAFLAPCGGIRHGQRDECLGMDPPELLIPCKLIRRAAFGVQEIEDPAMPGIPPEGEY